MKFTAFLIFNFLFLSLSSQTQKYWVFFKDKPNPLMPNLSPKSIERRAKFHINIDYTDYPVSSDYVKQIEDLGFTIEKKSKWLNAVSVYADAQELQFIQNLPFVVQIQPVIKWKVEKNPSDKSEKTQLNYGNSEIQNQMINIPYLHNLGYTGSGILIGIFDSGFINANQHTALKRVFDNNKVVAAYNFVQNNTNVYTLDGHGTMVWSCIASYIPDTMVGTGYDAEFVLAITEDVGSETTAEEDNWLAAMEWADSLGVDIINTSLGYSEMDGGGFYTYRDMDGNTTIITRAADIASSKGILCVVSAGNEGNGSWKKITAPCDADSVLCVGSVNFNRLKSSFSSFGPSYDGRIKPDIMAMGGNSAIANPNLSLGFASGTSFSAPIITGLVACLWQANPSKNNMQIIDAIKKSSDRAFNPDTLYGWGIPDAAKADSILKGFTISKDLDSFQNLIIYPNPAHHLLYFKNVPLPVHLSIFDFTGKLIYENAINEPKLEVSRFPRGWILIHFRNSHGQISQKIYLE